MTILNIRNLTLQFPGTENPALADINYTIKKGDFIILLGSNGSGKSTLLKLLHRYYQANQGEIYLFDKPITQHHEKEFSRHVAVLTQNCSESLFTSLTVYENYLLICKDKKNRSREFLQSYLYDYNPNLAIKLNLTIDLLSGGEKQALALALCLLEPPSLLLLDEHTSALDPKTSAQIMQLTEKMILKHHITCILTTHDLDIAEKYGNRILVLRDGKIYQTFEQDKKGQMTKELLVASYK